jgi:hypothetical protein
MDWPWNSQLPAWLGVLIGVVTGHYLTRSWQREQWLRDCRKEEFRELLTTLTRSYAVLVPLGARHGVLDAEARRALAEASASALTVLRDRIYVAEDVKRDQILHLWSSAVKKFGHDYDEASFGQAYSDINSLIVFTAKADDRAPSAIRRSWWRLRRLARAWF